MSNGHKATGILVEAEFSEEQLNSLLATAQQAILNNGGSKVYEWESGDVKVKKSMGLTPLMMVAEVQCAKAYHGYGDVKPNLDVARASFR